VRDVRRQSAREQRVDDRHTWVRVDWLAEREAHSPLQLSSSFLLRREAEGLRVVVYLNHHDVRAQLVA